MIRHKLPLPCRKPVRTLLQRPELRWGSQRLAFLLGAMCEHYTGATVHAYGLIYGTGAAVIEFKIS